MTVAPPPTWPASRVLASWWPHLDRLRPRSLWLYHLLLHRVEAPVVIAPPADQERLARLLLEVLASPPPSGGPLTTTCLAARLHFDPQVLRRLLADLESAGLVRSAPAEQGWSLSPAGEQVAAGPRAPTRDPASSLWTDLQHPHYPKSNAGSLTSVCCASVPGSPRSGSGDTVSRSRSLVWRIRRQGWQRASRGSR